MTKRSTTNSLWDPFYATHHSETSTSVWPLCKAWTLTSNLTVLTEKSTTYTQKKSLLPQTCPNPPSWLVRRNILLSLLDDCFAGEFKKHTRLWQLLIVVLYCVCNYCFVVGFVVKDFSLSGEFEKTKCMWFLLPIGPIRYLDPQMGQTSSWFTRLGKAAMWVVFFFFHV